MANPRVSAFITKADGWLAAAPMRSNEPDY